MRAVGIDLVEHRLEDWYGSFKLSSDLVEILQGYILDELDAASSEADQQNLVQGRRQLELLDQ